jgi:hypothetical protein
VTSLVCPSCGLVQPESERFCAVCGVPLIVDSDESDQVSERRQAARKIKPQLAEGRLVKVAGAGNQAEGEFIQGLLLEEGVPSMLRRSAGFDVPDFLAAGPRDVLVPESGAATAREILLQAELISPQWERVGAAPLKLFVWLLVALAIGALIAWLVLTLRS